MLGSMNKRSLKLLVAPAALAVLAAGCGGGSSKSTTTAGGTPTPSGAATAVKVQSTSKGAVLADASGRTLYILTSDKTSQSACTGSCLSTWPPDVVASVPSSGSGISAHFGTFDRGGQMQLTVNGMPVYRYAGDSAPGDVNGEGIQSFGGTWYAVSPSGAPIKSAGGGNSSTPSSGGGGYTY